MQIREAILKAADHIEANPGEFNFCSAGVPYGPGCGTPGCALGWIGAFAGHRMRGEGYGFSGVAADVLGLPTASEHRDVGIAHDAADQFYRMMDLFSDDWRFNAVDCAAALRTYADRYHPEEYPEVKAELNRIFAVEHHGTGIQQAQVTGPKPCPAASVNSLAGQGIES